MEVITLTIHTEVQTTQLLMLDLLPLEDQKCRLGEMEEVAQEKVWDLLRGFIDQVMEQLSQPFLGLDVQSKQIQQFQCVQVVEQDYLP